VIDFGVLNACTLDAFGEPVILWPGLDNALTVNGVVNKSARPEEAVPGNVTRLFLQLSDLTSLPARRDHVTVRGVDYEITAIPQGDDGGGLELLLRKT
jgi:hypothetical protein